jgi:transposase-like protein
VKRRPALRGRNRVNNYDRSLQVGSIPVDVRVPRTRNGDFRPTSLPAPYRRGYSEEVQSLLLGLLASSRSINAAKDALQKMGLSRSEHDMERVAVGLIEELNLHNSRPIHPDVLALFVDAKYIELRDGDNRHPRRRQGLLPITASLFANADTQLCVVHMLRNAKTHLSKIDGGSFSSAGVQ